MHYPCISGVADLYELKGKAISCGREEVVCLKRRNKGLKAEFVKTCSNSVESHQNLVEIRCNSEKLSEDRAKTDLHGGKTRCGIVQTS